MAQQSDNPAQPLIDRFKKWTGQDKKPAPPPKPDTTWHDEQVKKANESFQKPQPTPDTPPTKPPAKPAGKVPSYKKGGKVHKTGLARLHKGERVIPTSKVHKVEKAMRKISRKRG